MIEIQKPRSFLQSCVILSTLASTTKASVVKAPTSKSKKGTAKTAGKAAASAVDSSTDAGADPKTVGEEAQVFIIQEPTAKRWAELLSAHLSPWQLRSAAQNPAKEMLSMQTPTGPVLFLKRQSPKGPFSHGGQLEDSVRTWFREQGGLLFTTLRGLGLAKIKICGENLTDEAWLGLFLGFELAAYQFKAETFNTSARTRPWALGGWSPQFTIQLDNKQAQVKSRGQIALALQSARALGESTNLARHLVNLPPNAMNPTTWAVAAKSIFKGRAGLQVDVWDEKRLKAEKMGLLLGVGAGSPNPPCLIHFRYRPAKKSKLRPLAIVGKGITFDTGGLDLKPAAGMRLMKKDMGGGAAVFALAWWASETKYAAPLDFYLAVAENAVDGSSFRPSDILIARNGMTVEIHNTDAEGRLVLGDALDVAVSQEGVNEPESVINLATLTGAIKTALGGEIAGLFSNDDRLSKQMLDAGTEAGELSWRMPLLSRYAANFSSPFADLLNAVDGFGGAITAALFLERFVRNKSWAHLDIYGWTDRATGSLSFTGANGQGVQTMAAFLERRLK